MPFTTSHPAIIIPIKELFPRYTSLTGLMAGAMSPDLLYFLTMITEDRGLTHSWNGFFLYCLPLGIAFSFAFHKLFKFSFLTNLPSPLDKHFSGLGVSKFEIDSLKKWSVLIGSIMIGILSHFFWDAFTHPGGQGVEMLPILDTTFTIFGHERMLSRWLQHLSSILGGFVVLLYIYKKSKLLILEDAVVKQDRAAKLKYWFGAVLFMIVFALSATYYYDIKNDWEFFENGFNGKLVFMTFGLGSWAGFFWWTVLYGLLKKNR